MEGASKGVMGEAGAGGGDREEAGAASCDWGPAEGCSEVDSPVTAGVTTTCEGALSVGALEVAARICKFVA